MKKFLTTLFTVTVFTMLAFGTSVMFQYGHAQDRGFHRGMGNHNCSREYNPGKAFNGHGTAFMLRIKTILHQLNLSDKQRNQIHEIILKHKKYFMANFKKNLSNRVTLWKVIHCKSPSPESITRAMEPLKTSEISAAREAAKTWSEILPILTSEQKTKVSEIISNFTPTQLSSMFTNKRKIEGRRMMAKKGRARCYSRMHNKKRNRFVMGRRLSLTNGQRTKIKNIYSNHKATLQNLATDHMNALKELLITICAPKYDNIDIENAVDRYFSIQKKAALERASIFSSIYTLLTPEQRKKLESPVWKNHRNRSHHRKLFF